MFDITFTGEDQEMTREQLKALAEQTGHKVRSSVTTKTNLLVASYKAAKQGSTKWLKAQRQGIRTISYQDFKDLVTRQQNGELALI